MVSIHAPAWGATYLIKETLITYEVSIHAPAWGATSRFICIFGNDKFQSTHPRGVRPMLRYHSCRHPRCFNPRTRVGCDPPLGARSKLVQLFQSTHPRGVRHWQEWEPMEQDKVSIHAPAWGATSMAASVFYSNRSFNPRTRVGCDLVAESIAFIRQHVSIHAPAWGATCRACRLAGASNGFNPRTRVGCDWQEKRGACALSRFQSTHPRGVRRRMMIRLACSVGFQSTHPRGVRRRKNAIGRR